MLQFSRKESTITVPSGYKVTHTELVGKHQRILTESRIPEDQRFENLLIDIIADVDGTDWAKKDPLGKKNILKNMPEGDKLRILTEARQLAKSHNPTYTFSYKYKTKAGTNKTLDLTFSLIDEENLESTIEGVEALFGNNLTKEIQDRIRELNVLGGFPCKPSLKEYKSFQELLDAPEILVDGAEIDDRVQGYDFSFCLLTDRLGKSFKNVPSSSHKPLLERALKYKKKGTDNWERVSSLMLDEMPLDVADKLRNLIGLHEPAVDSLESFTAPKDHERGSHEVQVNLLSHINFFFPSTNATI